MALTIEGQLEQRRAALLIGNRVRYENAILKAEIGELSQVDGMRWVATLIRTGDKPSTESIYVRQLLHAIERVGTQTVNRWFRRSLVPGDKKLGQLSDRQRMVLADLIDRSADQKQTRGAKNGC